MRRVVLLCGPPGAGKTTWALASGLTVYDRDDPRWQGSEARFRAAITQLATGQHQAVVIRTGATRRARAETAHLIRATETITLTTDSDTCRARVKTRGRTTPPLSAQLAAIDQWWTAYEPDRPRTSTRW